MLTRTANIRAGLAGAPAQQHLCIFKTHGCTPRWHTKLFFAKMTSGPIPSPDNTAIFKFMGVVIVSY
jgi:hypothetical protein